MAASNGTQQKRTLKLNNSARELYETAQKYVVGGTRPLPVYLTEGKGSHVKDTAGNDLIDFICGFSASNAGQCLPSIVEAQVQSAQRITLANIASWSAEWPPLAKRLCEKFGYDKVTAMTSGAEAADTACKLARGWGIATKKINPREVLVLGVSDNYHGTVSGVWPLMEKEVGWERFGTFNNNATNYNPKTGKVLRYLHAEDYEEVFQQLHERIAAVIMEPLHGTSKSMQEEIDFCIKVRQLCRKYNILYIADEVRMGAFKSGKLLSSDWLGPENKPDMVTMAKSITSGAYPASFVFANNEVMKNAGPFDTLSTFAATPMACAVVNATLDVWEKENVAQRILDFQAKWIAETSTWKFPWLKYISISGSDMNVFLDTDYQNREENITARRLAMLCAYKGLLVYPWRDGRVRMGASFVISDEDLAKSLRILKEALEELPLYGEIEGSED